MWCQRKPEFLEGVKLVSAKVEEEKLKHLFTQLFKENCEDFEVLSRTKESVASETVTDTRESVLIAKAIMYTVQRLQRVLLSPSKLQEDLSSLGFSTKQTEIIVSIYSNYNQSVIKDLKAKGFEDQQSTVKFEVKTSLSNEVSFRNKTPVARISLKAADGELLFEDLDHAALKDLFDKVETIQKELDALSK